MSTRGFSIIELLVAMTITLLIAGALAGIVTPARAAFDGVPAELDLQQRGRAGVDTLSQAIRAAWVIADEPGTSREITTIIAIPGGARGVLFDDQSGAGGAMTLAVEQCPDIKDVCGFTAGATAIVEDAEGFYDVFRIASANAGARRVTPSSALSHAYAAGSSIVEVDQFTFRLDEQPDGSFSLVRETAAGAVQPVVDFVHDLSFEIGALRVDVILTLESTNESLRALSKPRPFRTSIKRRNAYDPADPHRE